MTENRTALDELISSLKQQRDQINVRIHLAGMEVKDEYERLSRKIEELSDHYEPVKDAVSDSSDNVISALKLAGEEMKKGLSRIWTAVKET